MIPQPRDFLMVMDTIYGFKIGQSQAFDKDGRRVPVTVVKIDDTVINKHQVAVGTKKNIKSPILGMVKNLNLKPLFIRKLESENLEPGKKLDISEIFKAGDLVKVTGISKGKGFAGVVKRHGFKGGPKTHGQSNRQRHPGSIGQTTTPGRVYKGKRMAGHMGNAQATVTGLTVFAIKPEENLLEINGLVPGGKGGLVKITRQI